MSVRAQTAIARPDRVRLEFPALSSFWMTALLIAVAFVVTYPVLQLLITSFQINQYGLKPVYGLDNWTALFTEPRLSKALLNTVGLAIARQGLAIMFGVTIAWLIARSNVPGRSWLEVGFWIALFMPALPVTLSWVFLAAGRMGFLNQMAMKLPFVHGPIFNLYSYGGILWVHMMTATLAIKIFLLVPAFRALNSALEEAARASGATMRGTLLRVVVPVLAPTIIAVLLIGLIRSMQAFEIELILGTPAGIEVYSTLIYHSMTQQPPLYGVASSLSVIFLVSMIPLVIAQQWYGYRHQYASVTGKFSSRLFDLGRWRWPIFGAIALLLFFMTVVPFICLTAGTFMKLFGIFNIPQPWTTGHWQSALSDGRVIRALWNSLRLGLIAAIAGMSIFTLVAYVTVKTSYIGRRLLDFFTWMPALIPGVVLSLGLLQMFTRSVVFRPFYGSMAILVLAILIGTVTVGSQVIRGALRQLGHELEEAGWAAGGRRLYTFRRIVLPLIGPSVAVIGLEVFATANSAVGLIAFLGTGSVQPLSMLQLTLLDAGRFETAAIVGIFIMVLTISSALLARFIAMRTGLQQQTT